jgi:hypothetical protein
LTKTMFLFITRYKIFVNIKYKNSKSSFNVIGRVLPGHKFVTKVQ